CPACADRADRLAALPALLAGAGTVGPVPVEVATGIDAALSAEAVSAGAPGARTVTPLDPARRRSPVGMRVLQAAAVLVLVLAGVGLALSALGGGNGGDAGTAGGSAADSGGAAERATELGQFPLTISGRAWTGTSLTAAVPDLLAARLSPLVDAQTLRESASGSDSSRTDAPEDEGANGDTGTPAPAAAPAGAQRLASGPALAECVAALADGPVTPLAVDLATWDGDPAAVILLPTPDDPGTVDAWVVAPDCAAADAKVLYFARLARP
ncbi:MAG TPA: hypothetical protein VFR56_11740, partial [Actinomycetes bacterium]|nr:hypothetical protein [Actinomycetes bacterium]